MKNLNLKFQKHIDNGLYQGIEWKIIYKGEVYHDKVGYSDLSSKTPLESNSLYRIWSMTKPIISVVILQLIQENKIKLDDPIKKYLPVFENLKVLRENSNSISDTQDIKNHPTIKDLLLHTAEFESFGLVAVEANACGTPVLTLNNGSLREIIRDNINGLFTENFNNNDKLNNFINTVLLDKEKASLIRESSYESTEKYSWEKTGVNTTSIYQQLA